MTGTPSGSSPEAVEPMPPYLLVHHDSRLSLAVRPLQLGHAEAQSFESSAALLAELASLRESESARIAAACDQARASGQADGQARGQRLALESGADRLASVVSALEAGVDAEQAALRAAVLDLALLVLRRMAPELAPAELLAGLAAQAFDRIAAEQAQHAGTGAAGATVVRAHPDVLTPLRECVLARACKPSGAARAPLLEWRADTRLGPLECVLETPGGRLLAGLEAQLERVQQALRSPAVARALPDSADSQQAPASTMTTTQTVTGAGAAAAASVTPRHPAEAVS